MGRTPRQLSHISALAMMPVFLFFFATPALTHFNLRLLSFSVFNVNYILFKHATHSHPIPCPYRNRVFFSPKLSACFPMSIFLRRILFPPLPPPPSGADRWTRTLLSPVPRQYSVILSSHEVSHLSTRGF